MRSIRWSILSLLLLFEGGCAGAPELPAFPTDHPASNVAPEAPIVARSSALRDAMPPESRPNSAAVPDDDLKGGDSLRAPEHAKHRRNADR